MMRRDLLALSTALAINGQTKPAKAAGWQQLFDGKSFHGWEDPRVKSPAGDAWSIEDGCLKANPNPRLTEDLFTRETFRDFELAFEWRVARGSNSGVKYRIQDRVLLVDGKFPKFEDCVQYSILHPRTERPSKGQEYVVGFEYQVIDNTVNEDAVRGSKYQSAALYDLAGPTQDKTRPVGEFNESRLLVRGNHAEHWLNGAKVVDVDLEKAARDSARRWGAGSEVYRLLSTQPKKDCQISLQNHGDTVWFRKIEVRRLS